MLKDIREKKLRESKEQLTAEEELKQFKEEASLFYNIIGRECECE